ncbi:hypothetical protein IQ259_18160 [Fortiea sp. LEGE XX443]|uniref:hypothetical protein n=1 Tax=Fortiea sp. LEGE XX443 TaxID=1828611 RepID=UPI001880CD44|nr:hypothetical protein [Fortiea sp. LEGE XX443]MBE9006937.1 hypothetical protein [Fortiea sp. LEGE XX443]
MISFYPGCFFIVVAIAKYNFGAIKSAPGMVIIPTASSLTSHFDPSVLQVYHLSQF